MTLLLLPGGGPQLPCQGVFRTFPRREKSATSGPHLGSELSADFKSPRRRLIPTSSGRMSPAACGRCCPLDAGTWSARTQKSSGTARDDGHGERHWARLLLHGLRGKRGTCECVIFLVHPLHRRSWLLLGDWDGLSSCVSLRVLLQEFPVLCARAVRTWNLVHYFRCLCGSHCSGRLGVAEEYGKLVLREMSISVGAMLGLTVGTFSASVLRWLRTYFTHLLRCGGLASGSVLSPFGLNGEACPVDASGCSFALRTSHLETWKSFFYELHVAAMRDQGHHFLGHLCQSQVPGCWFNP